MAPATEAQKAWRLRNLERVRQNDLERNKQPGRKERHAAAARKHWLTKARYARYGITKDDFDRMLADQDGKCKTCLRPQEESRGGTLVIDHCHKTNRVRCLLCHNCNVILGLSGDRPEVLTALARVLYEQDQKQDKEVTQPQAGSSRKS